MSEITNLADLADRAPGQAVAIEVKFNNCITNDPCAICGSRCDPVGIDPFVKGTWALVCDACAWVNGAAPVLDGRRRRWYDGHRDGQ